MLLVVCCSAWYGVVCSAVCCSALLYDAVLYGAAAPHFVTDEAYIRPVALAFLAQLVSLWVCSREIQMHTKTMEISRTNV